MYPRRYVGKDIAHLFQTIKKELGEEAIILSNKTISEGTEIYAMSAKDMQSMAQQASMSDGEKKTGAFDDQVSHLFAGSTLDIPVVSQEDPQIVKTAEPVVSSLEGYASCMIPGSPVAHNPNMLYPAWDQVMAEIADMKKTLSAQIADLQWKKTVEQHPAKEAIARLLLQCGYSTKLSKDIMSSVPSQLSRHMMYNWLRDTISSRVMMQENDRDFLQNGGVFAFLGATGVGKTTTVAKLAARFVLHHGPKSVVLLTTDHYRVCAYEQLRIFGDLLSVPVFSVRSASDLRTRLIEYKEKKAILIDTQGIAQKNTAEINGLLSLLSQSVAVIQRYLVCSCTTSRENAQEVIDAYQPTSTHILSGVVLTKLDEAPSIAPVIDALMRARLPIHYMSYGTKVPDDLSTPNRQYLLTQALNPVSSARDHLFDSDTTQALMSGTEIASHSCV